MVSKTIKISIITATFNSEKTIRETIESVVSQSYSDVEYIVIDGGSTDKTLEIVNEYGKKIHKVVSEKDDGIYDAFNKGIRLSSGEIIGILNSDDMYYPETLNIVVSEYEKKLNNFCLISGSLEIVNEEGNLVRKNLKNSVIDYFNRNIYKKMPLNHPATFVGKSVYENVGLFDTSYRIVGDYEFILRCYNSNADFIFTQETLTQMREGGVSSGLNKIGLRGYEYFLARKKNTNINLLTNLYYTTSWIIKKILFELFKK